MDWIQETFLQPSAIQTVIVLSVICATGLALGKIKIAGISLGITFIFFAGILAGHLGIHVDREMIAFAQNAGLILFVYTLGLQVGPGFFSSFKKGGVKLNSIALALVLAGFIMAIGLHFITDIPLSEMMGLFSGAVTNTPMLGAAQQAVLHSAADGSAEEATRMALACAVTYPLGVVGMIAAIIILKSAFGGKRNRKISEPIKTYLAEYRVDNPAVFGKSIQEIRHAAGKQFVISRVWKNGRVIIPTSDTIIEKGERLLVISAQDDVEAIETLFGKRALTDWNKADIDWNAIDRNLISRRILITKPELNGVKLGSLRLRNLYGINITRINRAGIDLLASPQLRLQLGDTLTVVGETASVDNVVKILGNEEKRLNEPNLIAIFTGLALGVILGSIPLQIPGMSMPIKLGIAGGPIIIGILMGAFGPRFHITTYTTQSANLMLRQIGIVIYLAGLGLDAGEHFFETVFCTEGLVWVGIGLALTLVPVLIVGFIAGKFFKTRYAENVGMLCGSMANPMALNYANTTVDEDTPSVAYATVYPLSMFVRVILVQFVLILFS